MKVRTKEEMTLYRRELRARKKLVTPSLSVTKSVTPSVVTPIKSVTPEPDVVTPCAGCLEKELQIKKLTVRVAFLEESMERYASLDKSQKSAYRLGTEFRSL